jgi:hypothetical protein
MLKLTLRVLILTTVLVTSSLVFAEELIVTSMILLTVALSTLATVIGQDNAESLRTEAMAPEEEREPVAARLG